MTHAVLLSVRDLTIRYGDAVAVAGVSLDVHGGEVYGLLGPNGSGKSSTLAAIAGTLRPSAGEIRVRGLSPQEDRLRYPYSIGLVPQELALYEELSATDNVYFFARLYGLRGRELRRRAAEALEFVQLTEQAQQPVRTLSGGMQRRLNLACALPHQPALLLLDEPTVGIDVSSRDTIFDSLRELRTRGTALVFSTHHLHEVELLCDRIGMMNRGRLVAEGTLAQLDGKFQEQPVRRPRLELLYLQLTSRSGGTP